MMKKMYDVVPGNPDNCPAPPEHCLDCKHNSLCLPKMEREWEAAQRQREKNRAAFCGDICAIEPFYSEANMERLNKSIAQMEAEGGTIHEVSYDD